MPNNISVKDAACATQVLKTTETAGIHTPHHRVDGTVAVDGSGVTQPVSGTVTANAGTNLNTSALALETTATAIKTAVETLDNAIAGNQMQVDIVSGTVGISGTVPVSGTFWQTTQPVSGTVGVSGVGSSSDTMAGSDSENASIVSHIKRHNTHLAVLRDELGGGSFAVGGAGSIGRRNDAAPANATDSGSVIAFLKRLNSAFDTVFGTSFLSSNNSQATFRISHPYGTFSAASPAYIIAPNVPQLVFSAKTTTIPRRSLQIQNVSETSMYVGFGSGFYANPMASGAVNAVQITNGGSGYVSAPTVTFSAPTGSTGRIATATGTAVISGGVVTSIQITDGGGGYLSAPTITFGSGSATATSIIGSVGWFVAPAPGAITFDRGFIPNDAVYIACGTAGKAFVAFQA